jgi:hypothetical protein
MKRNLVPQLCTAEQQKPKFLSVSTKHNAVACKLYKKSPASSSACYGFFSPYSWINVSDCWPPLQVASIESTKEMVPSMRVFPPSFSLQTETEATHTHSACGVRFHLVRPHIACSARWISDGRKEASMLCNFNILTND